MAHLLQREIWTFMHSRYPKSTQGGPTCPCASKNASPRTRLRRFDLRWLDILHTGHNVAELGLEQVPLIRSPARPLWMLACSWEGMSVVLNVRAAQVEQWWTFLRLLTLLNRRHHRSYALLLHALNDSNKGLRGRVGTQRPRCIHVSNSIRSIRQILEHHILPDELVVVDLVGCAVDRDFNVAAKLDLQASGLDLRCILAR